MNVGDYVRIINTLNDYVEIIKIKELNEYDGYLLDERNYQYSTDEIIKSSPQIIDLIEVGDYVNGNKIVHIQEEEFPNYPKKLLFAGVDENNIDDVWEVYNNEDIKTIVTHEQMEAMQYRVEE